MPSLDRRAAARRRAWGRGPMILRFEPLEGRQLLAGGFVETNLPDLVATSFDTPHNADWNNTIEAKGVIANQGAAPVPPGALAAIYASRSSVIGPGSVLVGVVQINAGLKPGATQAFDQQITLPPSPLVGMNADTQLWIGLRIDPNRVIAEQNRFNKEGIGPGVDQSVVTITPKRPSNLVGTSFGVSPDRTSWGQAITVTAQVKNNAQGDAPATRAKIVLTPNGLVPGGPSDVTIGSIALPALPAFQATNAVQTVLLPPGPPSTLAGQGAYLISIIQDADNQASPVVAQPQVQGLGLDTAVITIGDGAAAGVPKGPLPDLAATGVVTPSQPLFWGQSFQVTTSVQNIGKADSPGFKLRFLLTGVNGSTDHAIFLGDANVAGLKAHYSQDVLQTVQLPSRLPYGYNLGAVGYGRIMAIVDPENQVDETYKTNNGATSAPITLRLLGADGTSTVPTLPPVRSNQPVPAPIVAPKTPPAVVPFKPGTKLPRKPASHGIVHEILNYPETITNFFKGLGHPKKK